MGAADLGRMATLAPEILVVDDERLTRLFLSAVLSSEGYRVTAAPSGEEALDLLSAEPGRFHAVVLDRNMDGMNGVEVLSRMKRDARLVSLPVVLETAATHPEEVLEGLRAGAFYYLAKPVNPEFLRTVVRTAVQDHTRYRELQEVIRSSSKTLALLESGVFRFRTREEADRLTQVLANAFPDPDSACLGLSELLVNAVEHGNLEIGYDAKGLLVEASALKGEIERRLQDPVLGARRVTVEIRRDAERLSITIQDEGPGFDWKRFLLPDPERLLHNHGRGIFMAVASGFDRVEFMGCGNCVMVEAALLTAQPTA